MTEVLEKIERLRKERGWSIYKLAEEACLGQSTISNMFTRKTLPSLFTLNQICEAFGITLSEFFEEQENGDKETKILSIFRQLDDDNKKTLTIIANALLKNKK